MNSQPDNKASTVAQKMPSLEDIIKREYEWIDLINSLDSTLPDHQHWVNVLFEHTRLLGKFGEMVDATADVEARVLELCVMHGTIGRAVSDWLSNNGVSDITLLTIEYLTVESTDSSAIASALSTAASPNL